MNVEDLVLVSVDDHIIEPREMFDAHIPERYRDRAPRVLTDDDGSEYWLFEGERAAYMGLNAVAGCPPEEYGLNPTRYDQMRKGCYDVDERVRDMNANGVLGSLNFPTFPHFCGQLFARQQDKDLSLAVVRAYNDWHIDEWCGAHPGRFIPCGITPYWDPDLMAEEVRRIAGKGCHAVTFSENPEKLGHPSLHSDHWDPFWAACQESETVVCLHIGSSSSLLLTATDAPADVMISITPMNSFLALNDLMWTPIFKKFPSIKIAMSEGGIGWIPYALERMDYVYEHHHSWTGADFGGRRPSDVYRDHIVTCFIDDAAGSGAAPPGRRRLHHLGMRLPALRQHVAALTGAARQIADRDPGRRGREDDPPQCDAGLPVRSLRRPPQRQVHSAGPSGRGLGRGYLDPQPRPHERGRHEGDGARRHCPARSTRCLTRQLDAPGNRR